MPLSELHSKFDTSRSKAPNCTALDPQPYTLDGEFAELLWENGPIVLQGGGQSARPTTLASRKSSLATVFPSIAAKLQEKASARDEASQRLPRFYGAGDHLVSGGGPGNSDPAFPASAVSSQMAGGFGAQDDDLVPWVNSAFDDYYSELLGDLPTVNVAPSPFAHNGSGTNLVPASASIDRGVEAGSSMTVAKIPPGGLEQHQQQSPLKPPAAGILADANSNARIRAATNIGQQAAPAAPPPPQPQWPNPIDCGRAKGLMDVASTVNSATSTQTGQTPCYGLLGTKPHRQSLAPPTTKPPLPPQPPSSCSGIVNFSHFSRPSVLLKANNVHSAERLQSNDKASTAATCSNPMESTLVESSSGFKGITNPHLASSFGMAQAKSTTQPLQELRSANRSEPVNWKDTSRDDRDNARGSSSSKKSNAFNDTAAQIDNTKRPSSDQLHNKMPAPLERKESEKPPDTVVASSSVCSGIGAGISSNSDPRARAKRKIQEGEESGYQSEDLEDESIGLKKPATARAKRSRAAEVHNLSERRRRDRINEKMRALQELIPNCNKVDKASMLDEAIEYLKTLQLQIQIMSMGNGMCMPPMMLPAGMQQLRQPHLAHMTHLGLGMGMGMGVGMGFGMGMVDMNGSPLIPGPLQGPQFPCSMMTGTPGLHGIPGSGGLQMFGMPSQGIPIRMPCGPPYPPLGTQSTAMNTMPAVPLQGSTAMQPLETVPGCSDGIGVAHLNSDSGNRQGSASSEIPLATQATTECADQSISAQIMNQTSNSDDPNSSSGNGNSSTGTSYG